MGHNVFHRRMALAMLKACFCRCAHYCTRHRVRKMLFQTGRKAQNLGLIPSVQRQDAVHLRCCLGQGAGFIKDNGVGFCYGLKVSRTLHGKAQLGALT